jgi:pimeloyl-ACP methyl ester carboxylesterase
MPTLIHNSSAIHYDDRGTGDPPIVFIHGVGRPHFSAQSEHFAARHRVVVPDLPGYGRSHSTYGEYTISAFAREIAWLCNQLDLRRPTLVGHSMAAAIVLELGATQPDLPSALVLLDPTPIAPVPLFRERMTVLVEALHGPGCEDILRGFVQARMFRETDDPDQARTITEEICCLPQNVIAATLASALAWPGESFASRVRLPVLLIQAGDGMPSDLPRTRALIPQIELGRTVGAGHFAHALAADQVNSMIERFLATQ